MPVSLSLRQKVSTDEADVSEDTDTIFADYYEAHREQVYRYLYGRTGNREDAHDLTAQTFIAAYEHFQQYKRDAPFLNWVMGIARHKCVDYYRQKREVVALDAIEPPAHPAPLPEEAVSRQLRLERVASALQTISESRREAVALRLFAGMSNPEIADVMDKTSQAVAVLVHRGLQDLQAQLAEGDD